MYLKNALLLLIYYLILLYDMFIMFFLCFHNYVLYLAPEKNAYMCYLLIFSHNFSNNTYYVLVVFNQVFFVFSGDSSVYLCLKPDCYKTRHKRDYSNEYHDYCGKGHADSHAREVERLFFVPGATRQQHHHHQVSRRTNRGGTSKLVLGLCT